MSELQDVAGERHLAERARQQALILVAKQDAKIAECDAATARLNRVLERLGGNAGDTTMARSEDSVQRSRGRVTVRAVAQRFFTENAHFDWEDLLDAVRRQIPDANISTVRAELSRAKTSNAIRRLNDRSWESRITTTKQSEAGEDEWKEPDSPGGEDEPDPAAQQVSAADWRAWEEMGGGNHDLDVVPERAVPLVRSR